MPMNAPRILVLSATTGYQLRSFNEAAERLGIELAFATDRCHTLDDPWQDAAIPVRFHEQRASLERIVAAAAARPFTGVVAVGDRPTVLAARAAAALGLPGNPPEAAIASVSKLTSRQRFAGAGLATPWFHLVLDAIDPETAALDPRVRFPCVVKPTGLSGSRGVIRADSPDDLARALHRVRALLRRKDVRTLRNRSGAQILLEGFIEGHEYAVEGLLTDGRLQVLAIFDKPDPLDGPFFEETLYVTPPPLDDRTAGVLGDTVQRAVAALGLRHGAIHAECRLGAAGVTMLEVAARPIGGLCSRVLRFEREEAPGSQPAWLEEVLLRHAAGQPVERWRREAQPAAVMMIPIPGRGVFKRVDGEAEARSVAGVEDVRVTAKRDQLLEPLPEAGSYLGFIFARAESARAAEAAAREAHRRLRFTIQTAIDVSPQ